LPDNVEKYGTARQATDNTKRRMCIARRVTETTDTHSEYGRARQATDDNTRRRMCIARRVTEATDTHSEYEIHFCTATTVTGTPLDITFILRVHCQSRPLPTFSDTPNSSYLE
jgi:hypothetical protein